MIYQIINLFLLIICIFFIFLSIYPLNIYELISKSLIFDMDIEISKRFKFPVAKRLNLFKNTSITTNEGIFDIEQNNLTYNIAGNTGKLDLDKDFDKIIPLIIDLP